MNMGTYSDQAATPLPIVAAAQPPALLGWDWTGTGSGRGVVWVEYIGRTALVLTGPFTGQRYCFSRPGAKLAVDMRDGQALLAVPVLRLVEGC